MSGFCDLIWGIYLLVENSPDMETCEYWAVREDQAGKMHALVQVLERHIMLCKE